MPSDNKYIVFKLEDFERNAPAIVKYSNLIESIVEDAVVIRRQDLFSPPALDAYANAIMATVEVLRGAWPENDFTSVNGEEAQRTIVRLIDISDYFHEQAVLAWESKRKLPD